MLCHASVARRKKCSGQMPHKFTDWHPQMMLISEFC